MSRRGYIDLEGLFWIVGAIMVGLVIITCVICATWSEIEAAKHPKPTAEAKP